MWEHRNGHNNIKKSHRLLQELQHRIRREFDTGWESLHRGGQRLFTQYTLAQRFQMTEQTLQSWLLRVGHARDFGKLAPIQISHDSNARTQQQLRKLRDNKNKKQKERMASNLWDWLNS